MIKLGVESAEFGKYILEFLDGEISFDEFIKKTEQINNYPNFGDEEIIKLIWHTLYQYQLDIESDDDQYIEDTKYWMRRVAVCVLHRDPNLEQAINTYHNDPSFRY